MRHPTSVWAGIAILLLFFCARLWHVAPTHTDDATWRLRAIQGDWSTVNEWATGQGRVFAYISGILILFGCYMQETIWGPILHLGSFVIFFFAFYRVGALFIGTRLALLAAVLNLATFAVRWEGSVMTTDPIFCWALGTVFLAFVYLSRSYAREGRPRCLPWSLVLLFVSMNIHESLSVLFGLLAMPAVLASYDSRKVMGNVWAPRSWEPKFARHLVLTAAVVCLYFVIYVGFRIVFPSTYAGNQLGSLHPARFFPVLASLSTTGSVVTELIAPYSINYVDTAIGDNYRIFYKPLYYIRDAGFNAVALLCAALVAFQVYVLVVRRARQANSTDGTRMGEFRRSLIAGAAIALLPVLPVALVGKYQDHFFELDVQSYPFTPVCQFGWTLIMAAMLLQLNRVRPLTARRAAVGLFALLFGVLAYCSTMRNDAVVADIRRETCRWTVLKGLNAILPRLDRQVAVVYAPRLASGTWFTCVEPSYWELYMKARYGRRLRFENTTISAQAMSEGVVMVDYVTADDNAPTLVFAAPLEIDGPTEKIVAREIAVWAKATDPSDRSAYLLSYHDLGEGAVVRRLSALPVIDKSGVRAVKECRAVPSSIRLARASNNRHLTIAGEARFRPDVPVWFANEALLHDSGSVVSHWLAGKWHPLELAGTWSAGKVSGVSVPVSLLPREELEFHLQASTYTGLGFHDVPQVVQIKIGDRVAASRTFVRGEGFRNIAFTVHADELPEQGNLVISLLIDKLSNPAGLGQNADARDLGVNLKKLSFDRAAGSK